ncbi:MAG: hypothetical protein K6U04_09090 [Armatimonadetes bacterium]|nr:hypothetical protein [Armatimonadota bacterium]
MKGEAGEDPKQVLQQSIEAVKEVEDKSLQQDLLAVMGILWRIGGHLTEFPVSIIQYGVPRITMVSPELPQ